MVTDSTDDSSFRLWADRRNTDYGKVPGMDQAAGELETALAPLWRLMSFLGLRLYQKADVMQRMGRGAGTDSKLSAQLHWLRVSERAG